MLAQCFQQDKFQISSTFYIYQLTEDDVGKYVCEVSNGIGEPVKKTFNLLYHCKFFMNFHKNWLNKVMS